VEAGPRIASREAGLHKDLSRSQLVMIGLGGGDPGTGPVHGQRRSRSATPGPAVILSYAICRRPQRVAMVFSLSEMAVMHPTRPVRSEPTPRST